MRADRESRSGTDKSQQAQQPKNKCVFVAAWLLMRADDAVRWAVKPCMSGRAPRLSAASARTRALNAPYSSASPPLRRLARASWWFLMTTCSSSRLMGWWPLYSMLYSPLPCVIERSSVE